MENQIVDIEFEDGITCIGQIRRDLISDFEVAILDYAGYGLWGFNEELETVSKDCISGFYDTTNLQGTGLYDITKSGLYELIDDSDEEYVLEEESDCEDSGSEVSLEDEFLS